MAQQRAAIRTTTRFRIKKLGAKRTISRFPEWAATVEGLERFQVLQAVESAETLVYAE